MILRTPNLTILAAVAAAACAAAVLTSREHRRPIPKGRADGVHKLMRGGVARVSVALRVKAPRLVADWRIPNALAKNGTIRYNPAWIDAKVRQYCDSSACALSIVAGVLAHEFSHVLHADRYTDSKAHNHRLELRADTLAGWVLRELGHTADDAKALWRELVAMDHPTHPPAELRILAIERGFQLAALGYGWQEALALPN